MAKETRPSSKVASKKAVKKNTAADKKAAKKAARKVPIDEHIQRLLDAAAKKFGHKKAQKVVIREKKGGLNPAIQKFNAAISQYPGLGKYEFHGFEDAAGAPVSHGIRNCCPPGKPCGFYPEC